MVFDGHNERNEDAQALAYYQAYMSGVFSQPYSKNKFPPYEKHAPWKKARKSTKAQSWQQQKQLAKALNAAFGGTFSDKVH